MTNPAAPSPLPDDGDAIDVQGLTLRFGHLTAVDHIDLQAPYGIIFGLLGANGAGKPEWLRVIARLNPLTYLVDALRGLMVHDEQSVYGLGVDCGVLMLVFVGLLAAAVRLYPKLVQ